MSFWPQEHRTKEPLAFTTREATCAPSTNYFCCTSRCTALIIWSLSGGRLVRRGMPASLRGQRRPGRGGVRTPEPAPPTPRSPPRAKPRREPSSDNPGAVLSGSQENVAMRLWRLRARLLRGKGVEGRPGAILGNRLWSPGGRLPALGLRTRTSGELRASCSLLPAPEPSHSLRFSKLLAKNFS